MRGDVVTIRPNPPLEVRLLKGALPAPPGPLSSMSAGEIQKRIDLAESLASSGDIAASIAAYRELLSRVPALTSIYLRIGALHEQQEDSASALEAYRQLARLEPDNARALAAIARLSR
jgi:tetratricopeptide (TPR) repeat protein